MENQTKDNWLVKESIDTSINSLQPEQIYERLLSLLEKNSNVTDIAQIKSDMLEREKIHSPMIKDHIYVPHATTQGVNSFTLAIGIVNHTDIYVLVVWNKPTPHNIKFMAAVMEYLLSEKNQQTLLNSENPDKLYASIRQALHKYKI